MLGSVDDLFVGRRPILDIDLDVVAYELMYRHTPGEAADAETVNLARRVASDGAMALSSGRAVWLRVTPQMLADELLLPAASDKLIIEVSGDALREQAAEIATLRDKGVRVAARDDDDSLSSVALPPNLDLVRIDARSIQPVDLTGRLHAVRAAGAKVMAEHVETHDQHRWLKEGGVSYFQGLFLTQPEALNSTMPQNKLATLRLLAALDDPEISIDEVEKVVSQDVSLSYQILRYVNSAFIGLRQKVSSIRQAVVLLGPQTVRQIAGVALMKAEDSKPAELTRAALVRAKFCETIGKFNKDVPSAYYTAGLFSALEAMTDVKIEDVLDELPLTDEVVQGILTKEGPIGKAVAVAIAYEQCNWDDPTFESFDPMMLSEAYFGAIGWVDQTLTALMD